MKGMNTEITDSLLAAYVEGNVTQTERDAVRRYLSDHPDELESIAIMMDEDYDLDLSNGTEIEDMSTPNVDNSFANICYSAAAFVPQKKFQMSFFAKKCCIKTSKFDESLDSLLDDITK